MPTVTLTADLSTCAIRVRDFSNNPKDANRNRWTVGKMRHVIDALAGAPVAVTTDQMTGHTMIGVELETAFHNGFVATVLIRTIVGAESWVSDYTLADLGDTIIPLRETPGVKGNAKTRALRTYSDEAAAAIRIAKDHPDNAGNQWGTWHGEPAADGVIVRYTPHTGNMALAGQCGRAWTGRVVDGKVTPHAWAVGTFRDAQM